MSKYTKEQLRAVFQRPFDKETWKTILIDIFRANNVRIEPEKFTDPCQSETGWYMGNIETPDNYRIGLFFYRINSGSVAHKRVGLRNLVKSWVNPNWGEFDAAIIVFSDGTDWRLSFVCDIKDVATAPKRFTFVFGEKDNFYRTPIERFTTLQNEPPTFKNIHKAFSVEALSNDFFDQYRDHYADFVEFITGKRYVKDGAKWVEHLIHEPNYQYADTFDCDDKLVRDYIKKMFGRIVFLYFLQRKGWLDGNRNYMHDLFVNSDKKDDFLDGVLEPLFFEILNTDKPYRTVAAKALPGSDNIPYLNGGLFAADEFDELDCKFPESLFSKFIDFLDSYNFTIDENDTDDAEIGIDPEMLGRIFENLLEDNKDKGAFYTPKEIVDYMCRESIIAYLQNEKFTDSGNETIRKFVETYDGTSLSVGQRKYLKDKLKSVKICDPAIGSGAFPMGLVNLLSKLYSALRLSTDAAVIKRHIMEQNIYGVDIEKGAVDIARLRFWLAMIVEEKDPIPLPNLHFKIMQGNSLMESYNGRSLEDLTEVSVKTEPGTLDLDFDTAEQKSLVESLRSYYGESDHNVRDQIFDSIIKNVRRQIYDKNITLPSGFDPSANDQFFLWHTWFKDVFDKGGFDIVIGNPPYLKERNNKHIFEPVNNSAFGKLYHTGKMDYWFYFMHKAFDICKSNACVSFITSRYWINSNGAKKLIKRIKNIATIHSIVDIGSLKVFDNVVGHHMITQLRMSKQDSNCNYYLIEDDIKNIVSKDFAISRKIPQRELITNNFEISVAEASKAHGSGKELCDFCDVSQGVIEASDRISSRMLSKNNLPGFNVGDGIFVLSEDEKARLHLSVEELSVLGEYLNDGCLSRFCIKESNRYLIYSDKSVRENIATKPEFSRLKAHLDRMSPYITSSNKPYGLHRPRKKSAFISKKIMGPSMFKTPSFAIDSNGIFAGMSYNIVVPFKAEDIEWILAVLNSKYAEHWFNNNAKHRGIGNDVGVEKLRTFPMPTEHAPSFNRLKKNVLMIMSGDQALQELETEIDHIVYHLYDLTYDEVLIVDPETPITREEYEDFKIQ